MKLIDQLKKYHFEWKHLLVFFIVLIFFQLTVSYIQKISLKDLLVQTQDWYKQDSAERLANLATTSIELLLETSTLSQQSSLEDERELVQAFNIILSQQLLQQNVEEMCILVSHNNHIHAIDNGQTLYNYLFKNHRIKNDSDVIHSHAVDLYLSMHKEIKKSEQIYSLREGEQSFLVFVPLVPNGEYSGAVFLKITPDLSFISRKFIASYDEATLIFLALIMFGLLAMFYISSYTVRERDEAQKLLFEEREKYLRQHINHQKESLFTKRIYHTHHKAEKIMGFIKEDLRLIEPHNIDIIKYRVTKYANFVSRVIYDMKWYDPPLQTIRNPIFRTNLNEVLSFIVDSIFKRTSNVVKGININLDLDENLPVVSINEFVVWEIVEPLIQNSIDHSGDEKITINIRTLRKTDEKELLIVIEDTGSGIIQELLEKNELGIKRIFLENMSTKKDGENAGYGCYLSYEIAKRCGWKLDASNGNDGVGSRFILTIPG